MGLLKRKIGAIHKSILIIEFRRCVYVEGYIWSLWCDKYFATTFLGVQIKQTHFIQV